MPATTAAETIHPAINTPAVMHSSERLKFKLKIYAASEPVHAPVTGSGVATNRIRPMYSHFCILFSMRLRVCSNSHEKKESQVAHFLKGIFLTVKSAF